MDNQFFDWIRRHLRALSFVLGLGLFAYLIYRLQPYVILAYLKNVGFKFIFIILVSFVWYLAYAFAWEIFLKKLNRRVSLGNIFKIKIAGEAINNITPLSWGGGDPARILMLKNHIPFTEGTASVVVDRTLNNLAVALFMVVGIFISFVKFSMPPFLKIGLSTALAIILSVSIFLYARSHEGLFEFFVDLLRKLRLKKNFSESSLHHIREIDNHIAHFYKINRKGFFVAFGLHFFGRCCGIIEIYLAAMFLGQPIDFLSSYLLASLTVIVNMIFVFVPGTMGVMEGAFAGIFAWLHLNPAAGTSIQMVRRLRMMFWTTLGFVFMSKMKGKKASQ